VSQREKEFRLKTQMTAPHGAACCAMIWRHCDGSLVSLSVKNTGIHKLRMPVIFSVMNFLIIGGFWMIEFLF